MVLVQQRLNLEIEKTQLVTNRKTIELIVDANIVHITTDDTTAWTPTADEKLEDGVNCFSTQFPNNTSWCKHEQYYKLQI